MDQPILSRKISKAVAMVATAISETDGCRKQEGNRWEVRALYIFSSLIQRVEREKRPQAVLLVEGERIRGEDGRVSAGDVEASHGRGNKFVQCGGITIFICKPLHSSGRTRTSRCGAGAFLALVV